MQSSVDNVCVCSSSSACTRLELEREASLGGGGLFESGLRDVIEVVVAQAVGGRRSSEWDLRYFYGGSGAIACALACCCFALKWHADVAHWLVVR